MSAVFTEIEPSVVQFTKRLMELSVIPRVKHLINRKAAKEHFSKIKVAIELVQTTTVSPKGNPLNYFDAIVTTVSGNHARHYFVGSLMFRSKLETRAEMVKAIAGLFIDLDKFTNHKYCHEIISGPVEFADCDAETENRVLLMQVETEFLCHERIVF